MVLLQKSFIFSYFCQFNFRIICRSFTKPFKLPFDWLNYAINLAIFVACLFEAESTGDYLESVDQARARNQVNAVRGIRTESINSVTVEPFDIDYQNATTHEPHNRVSGG